MSKPHFSGTEIITWVDQWRSADYADSQDRAELSRHYSGGALDRDCEDDGTVGNINFLSGHRHLHKVFSELFAVYTRGKGFLDFEVRGDGQESRRRYVQACLNQTVNQVIKDSKRLRYPYWAVCGDSVLYGAPFLVRTDPYDWCPRYVGKPWMPRNAPADIFDDRFQMWAFASTLTLADLKRYAGMDQSGKGSGRWRRGAIDALMDQLKKDKPNEGFPVRTKSQETPEEIEYDYQSSAWESSTLRAEIPVYWFFRKDLEKKGKIDVYCACRHGESCDTNADFVTMSVTRGEESLKWDSLLFYEAGRFDNIGECLFPFLLDCTLGGEPRMHRILGLGKQNYDSDRQVQRLLNVVNSGVEDDYMPLYLAKDAATMERLEMLLKNGVRRNAVLPADSLAPMDRNRSRNFAHAESLMNRFEQMQSANTSSYAGGMQAGSSRELEIVALERQAEAARAISNRMSSWLETGDNLARAMAKVLLHGKLGKLDRGHAEAKKIRELLWDKGIDPKEYKEAEARMQRLPGGGDNALARSRAQTKLGAVGMFNPQAQQEVLREWVSAVDEDHASGEYLVPRAEEMDRGQEHNIMLQNAVALASGTAPQVMPDDIPALHAPAHLAAVQAKLEIGSLDPSEQNGVAALLEHAMMDIQLVAAYNPEMAKQLEQGAKQMAAAAEQMSQAQQAPAPEQHKMMIAERQMALSEQKAAFGADKFAVQQDHRERKTQTDTALKIDGVEQKRLDQQIDAVFRAEELELKREQEEARREKESQAA